MSARWWTCLVLVRIPLPNSGLKKVTHGLPLPPPNQMKSGTNHIPARVVEKAMVVTLVSPSLGSRGGPTSSTGKEMTYLPVFDLHGSLSLCSLSNA